MTCLAGDVSCAEVSADGSVQLAQRTLAAMIGVQRPSLNKVLKDFERASLIAIHYAGIDLVDIEGLKAKSVG